MLFYHVIDEVAVSVIRKLFDELMTSSFFDAVLDQFVTDAIIPEWHNKSIDDRIPETEFIRNVLIEEAEHILPVHTFRCRCDSQEELRLKVVYDLPIRFCCRMVAFIYDDVVPGVFFKEF